MLTCLIVVVGMILLLLCGTPVASSMLITGFFWILFGGLPGEVGTNLSIIATKTAHALNSFALLAVPFFMLAANVMNNSKVTERLFEFASTLVRHYRGGLGHVNVVGSMIFAGMSGSGVADAAGLGKIETRAMIDAGYDKPFTTAVTAASALIGPIIPPSIPFILFSAITYISAGKLLIGGFLPGIGMGMVMMLVVAFLARRRGYPKEKKASLAELFETFRRTFWAILTPVILVGGILSGVFTPTEAAAVAALYAMLVGIFIYRGISLVNLYRTFVETAAFCGILMFVVAAAGVVGRLLALAQVSATVADFICTSMRNPTVALALVVTFCFLMGCLVDDLSLLLILTPILTQPMISLGVDPVHWGVLLVIILNLGMITPPVGYVMFITRAYTDISLVEYTREILWFAIPLFILVLALILVPKLVLFLPNLVFQ